MPLVNNKYKKVLVLGSGALKIGEAGEFDYSGSQALKALKEEGVESVLVNPNIATVQTSSDVADNIYLEPVLPNTVKQIIERERPDGIFLAFGGQTALNCGVELYKMGVFQKFNVEVLGTPVETIIKTEDRELFVEELKKINVCTPRSIAVESIADTLVAAEQIGFPVIVRAAFTLGGLGSGFCSSADELKNMASNAFSYTSQILIEESLKGWKEVEYEVVRDRYDNCITVCNMENFDPLGIHTGESIVVAPSQTLSNGEYHKLRELSIKIVRHLGIVGECNVQFALDPNSEDYRVIEVNARLSRSSALASKATGYPLAFVAAKLGLGYGLFELKNSVTHKTTAFFEPALDYVVVKIPRWDLAKFKGVSRNIGSAMKSVGEVMAIGRSFEEAIQKGLRMIGQGMHGLVANRGADSTNLTEILRNPTDQRISAIARAFEMGWSADAIHEITRIDRWFLDKLQGIVETSKQLGAYSSVEELPRELLIDAKRKGFSDFQLARIIYKPNSDMIEVYQKKVREHRLANRVIPCVKQIDTLAAEFPSETAYLYLTYHGEQNDVEVKPKPKILVLGSGAYRIGSSVEFDWCTVSAVKELRRLGFEAIIVNYNPETVSTDYDECDKLYFDELTFERVMDIVEVERPLGVVVSVGGQIPNNLAGRLHDAGVRVLGTSPISIDKAEDRKKFSDLLDKLRIEQPQWQELTTMEQVRIFVKQVGYPVLIRPSYVLSGSAMNVVSNDEDLEEYLNQAVEVSKNHPVVISEFIEGAKEIEYDAVANQGKVFVDAISEHIEFAGVHSGDATLVFPPQRLYLETIRKIRKVAADLANELNITGPFNIQFLAKNNQIKVIECNLRASRSFPFVSKVMNYNMISAAIDFMLGVEPNVAPPSMLDLSHIGVKASQFSFGRLTLADPVLGVEMASTGEVGCLGQNLQEALLKAMLSVGFRIPQKAVLVSSGPLRSKLSLIEPIARLVERGLTVYATKGTASFLNDHGVKVVAVTWPDEVNDLPNSLNLIQNKQVDLVINIPKNLSRGELDNDYTIRRAAIDHDIPLITNARLAAAFIDAFVNLDADKLLTCSYGELVEGR
ncbi:carbamoyl-phosphate synthase (glutamine-hydrolyzing) large subunit [Tenuifilum thalassicum]|uniref:Carbamoyl-phosphate synthase (Glutamine-hydrolyzing) large subunit n=1 Tax=Tenuifilum thalassicum TaxID=2590900 RepID=A0A7D3XDJ5_9BACT|nr:carbamoyl-phosphate synthase (glutamine-hydrolyzing) large subunit [Tenuifilum thalassicum]QKG79147.1 carbamoyl-phosphate synthase (glutamine-hydrolyzing) large subunit [Tenuifilum thalassicum]